MGTSSARAGLIKKTENGGKLVQYHCENTEIYKPQSEFFEQSSNNIWEKVCECVKKVSANVDPQEILGIGFDATCSLVIFDKNFEPITASPTKSDEQNIIMWMDHRADAETDFINSKNHEILKYVGGKVSLEMEIPKLLWLKHNMPDTFQRIHLAFDLPDFLTWRATGVESRSGCSLTCKWNFDAVKGEWAKDFFDEIGLAELMASDARMVGSKILNPGDRVGGLTRKAASEMGLLEGTAVGCSMIDAHAGALGLIGSQSEGSSVSISEKLILIAGTSTCHMSITKECVFSPGIWGPYLGALLPNYFLIEAGQSASGLLIDHLIHSHPDYKSLVATLKPNESIHDRLFSDILEMKISKNLKSFHELAKDYHIYPDFHGNRSPIGDSSLKGAIVGCSMHVPIHLTYLAVIQSLAYQTKHIINSLYNSGRTQFRSIIICGGLSKNKLFVQTQADICEIPVAISYETESVLLGAAMLGATASGAYGSLEMTIKDLSNSCFQVLPDKECSEFHMKKFKVFLKMLEDQQIYSKIMNS